LSVCVNILAAPLSCANYGVLVVNDNFDSTGATFSSDCVAQAQTLSGVVIGQRSGGVNDQKFPDLSWLGELHKQIWDRGNDVKSQLYQELEVTQASFCALEERLEELYPDRGSPNYNGKKNDIQSLKLAFLREIPQPQASSPQVDDDHDPEANNEDDSEIHSFFPFTLRYLDLSTLKLQNIPSRFPLAILLRGEYDIISNLINEEPKDGRGCVAVSGQPGIGEVPASLSHRI
jgi:hypothetical protein